MSKLPRYRRSIPQTPTQVGLEHYLCECGGEFLPLGIQMFEDPMIHLHGCAKCDHTASVRYGVMYPRTIWFGEKFDD